MIRVNYIMQKLCENVFSHENLNFEPILPKTEDFEKGIFVKNEVLAIFVQN